MKRDRLNRKLTQLIENEIEIMKVVKSEYIVKLHKAMKTRQQYYLFTQFCNGCDLLELKEARGRLTETESRLILI